MSKKIKEEIERQFSEKTGGATVTCTCLDIHPIELVYGYRCLEFGLDDAKKLINDNDTIKKYFDCKSKDELTEEKWQSKKCFGELVTILSENLQRHKEEREVVPFIETIPFVERCDSCQIKPASQKAYGDKEICSTCFNKLKTGRKMRKYSTDSVDDLHTIGDESKERAKGYVGVIYADGNAMGDVLEKLKNIKMYKEWSTFVNETFQEAINETTKGIKHYERLVCGGDDIILLLPGDRALPCAEKLVKSITQKLQKETPVDKKLRKRMGLSAGVLIAHCTYPALYLVECAEQLLKSAKEYGKNQDPPQSAIDFAVMTDSSPLSSDIRILRKELYEREVEGFFNTEELSLIKRPFTIDEFSQFLNEAKLLKKYVTQSQLYFIRQLIDTEFRLVSELIFLYQVVRSSEDQSWKKWINEITGNNWSNQNIRNLIWKEETDKYGNKKWVTSFIDYTEAYHFIGKRSEQNERTEQAA